VSELIVEVCEVLDVKPHPNADRLELIQVKGWEVVVQKDLLKPGDPVVYFPPDSVLTEELADRLGIRKYLVPVKRDGSVTGYRVRAARLRGVASYGTIDSQVPEGVDVGTDVAALYGVTKWEPPPQSMGGLPGLKGKQYRANVSAAFHKYKSIEHLRNNRTAFQDGEIVVLTEKLHGTNSRVGLIRVNREPATGILGFFQRSWRRVFGDPAAKFEWMAGSHNVIREVYNADGSLADYSLPYKYDGVKSLLSELSSGRHDVILFGEIYGSGVQDMTYGLKDGEKDFAAFDISVDGRYLDADEKFNLFARHGIPFVPLIYRGPFSWDLVKHYTDGPTTMCEASDAGPFKGREGVVVTALIEPTDYPGRKIYKSVSADYLARANGTDSH